MEETHVPDDTPTIQLRNRLLSSLINHDYQRLVSHLKQVDLELGEVIYTAGDTIEDVYFPETAVVSLLSTLENGDTTEVGLIGCEGMVGLSVFLGGAITPERALVLLGGKALKMPASVLTGELKFGSTIQLQLLRYTRSFLALVTQSVICSQHHSLEARFARWLLMMHDYSESNTLNLTHEMVSGMIGTRRAGVSMATRELRQRNLIKSARGHITIIDREGLKKLACECYSIIHEEFERLHETQMLTTHS
jgi:CRP-like cAMP-binding protein